jgi:uncharacterized coiled-coil protein SlyX
LENEDTEELDKQVNSVRKEIAELEIELAVQEKKLCDAGDVIVAEWETIEGKMKRRIEEMEVFIERMRSNISALEEFKEDLLSIDGILEELMEVSE